MSRRHLKAQRPEAGEPDLSHMALSRSRPYRSARQDRGAETRAQLIEAGLDVFGVCGFEGATTREIAKAAGANLAAIAYHFGSKEALHIAVAEHVAKSMRAAIEPALADVARHAARSSPGTARAAFGRLIEAYVEIIVGSADAERWARFIVREQMQPSAAFDTIYGFMTGPVGVATRLISVATGRPEDEETKLRVFAMFGQVLVFRVSQALVTRYMGWTTIGERERLQIKRVVAGHVEAILTGISN
jgi:TetR/AcrR family transcriptional regulator, regulator of cefoperazone and chloramphenicol sensitivity